MFNIIHRDELPAFSRYLLSHGWSVAKPVKCQVAKFVKTNPRTKHFVFVEPHEDTCYKVKYGLATPVMAYFNREF